MPLKPDKLSLPKDVLVRDFDAESVLLKLSEGRYYGLDGVGARMLAVLCETGTKEAALVQLCREFDVDAQVIERDLRELTERLIDKGLLEFASA